MDPPVDPPATGALEEGAADEEDVVDGVYAGGGVEVDDGVLVVDAIDDEVELVVGAT